MKLPSDLLPPKSPIQPPGMAGVKPIARSPLKFNSGLHSFGFTYYFKTV